MSDTILSTQVISITGQSGSVQIGPNGGEIRWDAQVLNPPTLMINNYSDPIANGQNISIIPQSVFGGTGVGGNVLLYNGIGGGGNGNVSFVDQQSNTNFVVLGRNLNGGDAQIFVAKATANPTSAVTAGGILYVDSSTGNLMFLGSSGTARLVALA